MRIIFMGTPDFAVPALEALHAAGHDIACVYTQPPRPAGRGKKLRASPVELRARALGLEVRSPASLRPRQEAQAFADLGADVAVVAAYGLILREEVLIAPHHGCLNIHASILPRWRGAAPIHRAIMAGDEETGVTIMQMEKGLDTGPMRHIERTPIGTKTTGELTGELAQIGARAVVQVLGSLDQYPAILQDPAQATYAPKIDKAEARINWSQSAAQIERLARALAPFPGAFFELDGERIKLLRAEIIDARGEPGTVIDDAGTIACGEAALRPISLQRAGKPVMSAQDFLRGFPIRKGSTLS